MHCHSFSQMLFRHAPWNFKVTYRHKNVIANKAKAMHHHPKGKRKMLNEFWQCQLHLDHLALLPQDLCKQAWGEGAPGTHPFMVEIEWKQEVRRGSAWGPVSEWSHSGRNSHPLENAVDNYCLCRPVSSHYYARLVLSVLKSWQIGSPTQRFAS